VIIFFLSIQEPIIEYLTSNVTMLKWMIAEGYGDKRTITRRIAKVRVLCYNFCGGIVVVFLPRLRPLIENALSRVQNEFFLFCNRFVDVI
jgi:hypothetical protein